MVGTPGARCTGQEAGSVEPDHPAPQVDKILQEQCYAYAKQAGIKESEIDYSIIGSGQMLSKLVATLEAGNPRILLGSTPGYQVLPLPGPPAGGD